MWLQVEDKWVNMEQVTTVQFTQDETGPLLHLSFARVGDGLTVRDEATIAKIKEFIERNQTS